LGWGNGGNIGHTASGVEQGGVSKVTKSWGGGRGSGGEGVETLGWPEKPEVKGEGELTGGVKIRKEILGIEGGSSESSTFLGKKWRSTYVMIWYRGGKVQGGVGLEGLGAKRSATEKKRKGNIRERG